MCGIGGSFLVMLQYASRRPTCLCKCNTGMFDPFGEFGLHSSLLRFGKVPTVRATADGTSALVSPVIGDIALCKRQKGMQSITKVQDQGHVVSLEFGRWDRWETDVEKYSVIQHKKGFPMKSMGCIGHSCWLFDGMTDDGSFGMILNVWLYNMYSLTNEHGVLDCGTAFEHGCKFSLRLDLHRVSWSGHM